MTGNDDAPATSGRELSKLDLSIHWLIRRAAESAPAVLTQRLEEEWLAHLEVRRGALSRLCFAIGCCWATRVIAHDYLASGAPAGSAAAEHATIVLGQQDPYFSRRAAILLLIVGLHIFVIYGFATGFAQKVIEAMPGPIVLTFDNPPQPHAPAAPTIASHLTTAPPIIPKVTPAFEFPPDPIRATFTPPPPPSAPPLRPAKVIDRVLGGPGIGFPNTSDYYPLPSIRLHETGITTVRVCVDGRGRLAAAPTIARSSGIVRLDAAALQLAKAGSGHYRSTTQDGAPVTDCFPFRIRFQLED